MKEAKQYTIKKGETHMDVLRRLKVKDVYYVPTRQIHHHHPRHGRLYCGYAMILKNELWYTASIWEAEKKPRGIVGPRSWILILWDMPFVAINGAHATLIHANRAAAMRSKLNVDTDEAGCMFRITSAMLAEMN